MLTGVYAWLIFSSVAQFHGMEIRYSSCKINGKKEASDAFLWRGLLTVVPNCLLLKIPPKLFQVAILC